MDYMVCSRETGTGIEEELASNQIRSDRMDSSLPSDLGKLFIGGISWDTDEDRLREYFQNYGEVVEAVIMKDKTTGRARGFGFIVFSDPAAAERVVMDKHIIDGRTVEAKKAVPRDDHQHILGRSSSSTSPYASPWPSPARTKKIFVGGLASTVTETDFKNYFDQFGNITDVVVMYDHNTQRPRGFGFITYDAEEAVDKVLLKTFHELNGKMVEVKRAVPKELSPGPTVRSPLGIGIGIGGGGYSSFGLNRINSYLGNGGYAQGYNPSSIAGLGMRMDGRSFGSFAAGRNALPSFGPPAYGMGANFDPRLSPYAGNANFGNTLGYGRGLNPPYYAASSTRFNPIIGYGGSNGGNSSVISSMARNVWGNGSFNYPTASPNSSASGSFGNNGLNWGGSSSPISSQAMGAGSGYGGGNLGYGGGENNFHLGNAGFGRSNATVGAATTSFTPPGGGFDGNYADTYGGSSVYGDPTWRTASSEIDRSGPFGYGLGNVDSEVTAKDSSGFMGGYNVTGRQPNRDIVTLENELF